MKRGISVDRLSFFKLPSMEMGVFMDGKTNQTIL